MKNEDAEQRAKRRFWATKKKGESVCDDRPELFQGRANAHYSRENPGGIDDLHRRLEGVRWPHFKRL